VQDAVKLAYDLGHMVEEYSARMDLEGQYVTVQTSKVLEGSSIIPCSVDSVAWSTLEVVKAQVVARGCNLSEPGI
jgi:hypothetical protein